jgi:ribosomal protein S18
MNLLSQENSAKEDKDFKRQRTACHIKEELKDNTMNFDDLDLSDNNISDGKA